MDPISAIGAVWSVYQLASFVGGLCFKYAQGVKRAEAEADSTLDEIHNFQAALWRLNGMLKDEAQNETGGDRLQSLRAIMSEDSVLLKSCKTDLEKLRSKLEDGEKSFQGLKGQAKVILQRMKWPLKQEDVKRLTDNMRNVAAQIERAQSIDTTQMIRTIGTTVQSTSEKVDSMKNTVENATARYDKEEQERKSKEHLKELEQLKVKIMTWLKHADQYENHKIACQVRDKTTKTGQWFVEGESFEKFKHAEHSLLWLDGDSGSGKTILSSTIIESLRGTLRSNSQAALGFWYFNADDKAKTTLDECVRALITQFLEAMPALVPSIITEFWSDHNKGGRTPKLSDLRAALTKLLATEKITYYIVLDALDECRQEDQLDLLAIIQALQSSENQHLHILVTSRKYLKDRFRERFLNLASFFDIAIERAEVDEDIKSHVTQQLLTDPDLNRWDEITRNMIFSSLTAKAHGMFRWVDCQLQALRKCKKKSALIKALEQLPKDLQEQYTRELASVSEEDSEDALTLLKWLTFPQRKIRVEEALELLDVDYESEEPRFIPDEKVNGSDYVLGLCGSLVRTDVNKNGFNHLGEPAEVVTLTTSHATVLDFLKSREIQVGSLDSVYFTRESINLQMAVTCLGYLHSLFELEPDLDEDKLSRYPSARLCAEYWDDYYREVIAPGSSNLNRDRLNRLVLKLLDSKESTLKWVRLCDPDHDQVRVNFKHREEQLHSKLYYASLLGITDIVTHYLDKGENKNYTSKQGFGTPLVAAAYLGRTQIVQHLLEAGADPNLSGNWSWGKPLAVAVEANHTDIVKLLINSLQVDVNCCRHEENWQRKDIVKGELRELGERTDISKQYEGFRLATTIEENDPYNDIAPPYLSPAEAIIYDEADATRARFAAHSMLYIAVEYNSMEALDILLDSGAEPNQVGGYYHTALQAACVWDRKAMAEKLLNSGARCNIYGGAVDCPLLAACFKMESEAIIRQMIDCGADVNRQCRFEHPITGQIIMSTPLYAAVMYRSLDIVRLLLANHADPNIQGCEGFDNAFQAACQRGEVEIVRELLNYGVNPDKLQGGGIYDNGLNAAICKGHLGVVKLLLDKKLDPNLKTTAGLHPLVAACQNSDETGSYDKLVKVLLEHGADANAGAVTPEITNCTPIQAARTVGQLKMLLEYGANINQQTRSNPSPLISSIVNGWIEMTKYLLEKGADVQQAHPSTSFPLSKACRGESIEVVEALIGHADVNAMDDWFCGSALHHAVQLGNKSVIKLLLARGAELSLVHWLTGTPLMAASEQDDIEIFELIYNATTEHDIVNALGQNALLCAMKTRHWVYVERFLQDESKILSVDYMGCNVLHYAARSGRTELVEQALDSGIDVDSLDNTGWSALHWASFSTYGTVEVIGILLNAGAEREMRDKQGRTALDIAVQHHKAAETAVLRAGLSILELLYTTIHQLEFSSTWKSVICDCCLNVVSRRSVPLPELQRIRPLLSMLYRKICDSFSRSRVQVRKLPVRKNC
ncbi:hypothetical protein ACMFMF_001512 [Clarireedia jacksonii]